VFLRALPSFPKDLGRHHHRLDQDGHAGVAGDFRPARQDRPEDALPDLQPLAPELLAPDRPPG